MRIHHILTALIFVILLVNCAAPPGKDPKIAYTKTPFLSSSPTATQTRSPIPTVTATPSITPTEIPRILLFYGDSILKVGEGNNSGQVGFSIVDILRKQLDSSTQIITSNHGGRKAKWGYDNLDKNVLAYSPDIVTIWWGTNDLNGCPGIFNRNTYQIIKSKLDAYLNMHRMYMSLQIDKLLKKNIPVVVVTPVPILGKLPWSHFGPDNGLVWETNSRCDFNTGLEQVVELQRKLVSDFASEQKPVYLVDAWQIYKDHPNTDNMYMDILHPGGYGAELIAARWLQVYQSIRK
jgi:lysophospholipase L1-like esterase